MAVVYLHDGETLESALRRFKLRVQQEDILGECKRRCYYLKPTKKKQVKAALARKRKLKKRKQDSELARH